MRAETASRDSGNSIRAILPEGRVFGSDDIRFTACCSKWEQCQPGDLFVALDTADGDGHEEIGQAIARGAGAVLTERLLPVDVPQCVVRDTRIAHGRVCQILAGQPAQYMHVTGVTGTYGKTVTSLLIASVLESDERHVGVISSLGRSSTCGRQIALQRVTATPSAPELARWLATACEQGCSHAVLETSGDALANHIISGLGLDVAVITNIGRAPIDLHGSALNYRQVKARILEQLKPDGFAVLNSDDPHCPSFLSHLENPCITIGIRNPAEITAQIVERHRSEQTFLIEAGDETIPVRTRVIGDQHVYNCLLATAVGLVSGIDLTTIVRGLERVEAVPGRLERIERGQPFGVFVDSAQSPEGLANSLRSIQAVTSGKTICVFGAKERLSPVHRAMLGRVVERNADVGVITNDNPGLENPMAIAHDILDGFDRPAMAHLLPNREQAIRWAIEQARPEDTVLIAGKGDATWESVGTDDREIAESMLTTNRACAF